MNAKIIKMPPTKLNFIVVDIKINSMPKYIGFLEYLKMPEVTKEDAFSGWSGLTVVLNLLKDIAAVIKIIIPSSKNNTAIASVEM